MKSISVMVKQRRIITGQNLSGVEENNQSESFWNKRVNSESNNLTH